MRYRSTDRLTADAIGRRVTVRRRLPDGGASDTVGVLIGIDESSLTVRNKHGADVLIPAGDVVATRVVGGRTR